MSRKEYMKTFKVNWKDVIREMIDIPEEMGTSMYLTYWWNGQDYKERCFGHLFSQTWFNLPQENAIFPLKFNRKKNWFNYNKLFRELNILYGNYWKILRYFSGYKVMRLVDFQIKKTPKYSVMQWAGLYTAFLLLRKINVNYWYKWNQLFIEKPDIKPLDNWADIIFYSERYFYDSTYHIHNGLKSLAQNPRTHDETVYKWINEFLNNIKEVYGTNKYEKAEYSFTFFDPPLNTEMINTIKRMVN
jgi:hypothetical protein